MQIVKKYGLLIIIIISAIVCSSLIFAIQKFQKESVVSYSGSALKPVSKDPSKSCDTYFKNEESQSMSLPYSCEADLGHDTIVSINFLADGNITVKNGDKIAFDVRKEWDSTFSSEDYQGYTLRYGVVDLEDVTFDGYKDFILNTNSGAYNFTYSYNAFNPKTGVFDSEPLLTATNPAFDAKTKTISSFEKGRGLGDIYVSSIYQFDGKAYVLIREETQTTVSDDFDTSKGYVRTLKELKDGKMVVTKTENLTEEEVLGDADQQ